MINWILQRLAVGSSDWLGLFAITDWSWFGFWRFRCLELVMLLCLIALYLEVRILIECYRENKKRRSESYENPSEINQSSAVLVGGETDYRQNASEFVQCAHRELRVEGWILRASDELLHLIEKVLRALLEIVLRLRAHRPNETELSHCW